MRPLDNIRLVALREIQVRARSRAFRWSTLFIVALIVIGVGGSGQIEEVMSDLFEPSYTLGVVDPDPDAIRAALDDVSGRFDRRERLDVVVYDTADTARAALSDGAMDAILVNREVLRFEDSVDSELATIANQAVRSLELPAQLEELGLTPEQFADLVQAEPLETTTARNGDETEAASFAIASLAAILLFVSIMTYGQWILHGVVEEKSTRVIEILLSTIRPYQILAGKVLGILALAMMQLLALLITAGVVLVFADVDIPSVAAQGIVAAAFWFLLGLLLYGFIYGVAGALISRQEDAGNVILPFTSVLTLGYMATIVGVINRPDSVLATVLSLFPLTAPLAMPTRVALGEVGILEFVASVALTILATIFVIAVGARLYSGAVLRVGPRVALRDAWRFGR